MDKNKIHYQLVWGALLVLMGVAFFFQIPQAMYRVKTIESTSLEIGFIYFCLYIIDLGLIVGGVKKIYANYQLLKNQDTNDENNA
jgi:nitrate reductase gamma subunit